MSQEAVESHDVDDAESQQTAPMEPAPAPSPTSELELQLIDDAREQPEADDSIAALDSPSHAEHGDDGPMHCQHCYRSSLARYFSARTAASSGGALILARSASTDEVINFSKFFYEKKFSSSNYIA